MRENLHVRFDERGVETEPCRATKAPPDERGGKPICSTYSRRRTPTLPTLAGGFAQISVVPKLARITNVTDPMTGLPFNIDMGDLRSPEAMNSIHS
jgi:hypothetical protein